MLKSGRNDISFVRVSPSVIRSFGRHVPKIHPDAFVHDSAEIIGEVSLAKNASIWPLAVLRGDVSRIVIGENSNVQDLSVIHCRKPNPTIIGKGVTIGHNVVIHGARIGDSCLIGMGSIIMEAEIGKNCLVAAGTLVLAGFRAAPGSLILGRPGKVVRKLTAKEFRSLKESERNYLQYTKQHKKTSRAVFA